MFSHVVGYSSWLFLSGIERFSPLVRSYNVLFHLLLQICAFSYVARLACCGSN